MLDRTYIIIEVKDITEEIVKESTVTSSDTIRYNNDRSKAVLGFKKKFPNSTKGIMKYSHEEILVLLDTPEWKVDAL